MRQSKDSVEFHIGTREEEKKLLLNGGIKIYEWRPARGTSALEEC